MLNHHVRDCAKSHCWDVFISLQGWCEAFVMENGSIDVFDCSRQYQLRPKESTNANNQVVVVSSGTSKKAFYNHACKTENICSGKEYHTKTATTQIRQMELFCHLLIPCFYISAFETKTNKRLGTQIHCQKCHTITYVCQGLWMYLRTVISFLVNKRDEGI